MNKLTGYIRPDGRIGFRNHVAVVPLVGCVSDIARRISNSVPGSMPIIHPHGCEIGTPDLEWLGLQMERLVTHPNVGGVIFVTLGCGKTNRFRLPEKAGDAGKMVEVINFHQVGGTSKCIEAGVAAATKIDEGLRASKREPVSMSAMILGTKCGSSDPTSFEHLHPITGMVCDRIVDEGGTVVLAENIELWPGAEVLSERGVDAPTREAIRQIARDVEQSMMSRSGAPPEMTEQRRLATPRHGSKAGTRPIQKVVPLEGVVEGPGLVIHDGPNNDLISVTTMAVAGCNLQLFTTGRGTPVGGPCAPTIKVTANPRTEELMAENIDVGVGGVTDGSLSQDKAAEMIYDAIIATANGRQSKSELLGHFEMQFHIKGVMF